MNTLIKKKEYAWLQTVKENDVFVVIWSEFDSTHVLGIYDNIKLAKECVVKKAESTGSNIFMHIIKTEKNSPNQFDKNRTNKCLICNGIGHKCELYNIY